MYFDIRSDLDNDPVLIWVALVPTAISEIIESEVSPDLWEIMAEYSEVIAKSIALIVSDMVPIWFGLIRIELAISSSIPFWRILVFIECMF